MTLKVSLSEETESKLREQAAAAGKDAATFAALILEQAVVTGLRSPVALATSKTTNSSVEDFDAALNELFVGERPLPKPSTTYSRSDIYLDHD